MTSLSGTWKVVEGEAVAYRRVWRGSAITYFVNPVLFLSAMGIGLGSLVDRGGADLGIPYLAFVATGLLAASSMQNGAGDGAWAVMAGIKWRKNFHAAVATPVSPSELVSGRLVWGAIRNAAVLAIFVVIASLFGAIDLGPGLLALFPAVLTGVAFTAAVTAFTVTREDETSLSTLFRFGIVPLYLFSGTFFPIAQLPDFMQRIAWVTPLFHGVELVRKVAIPDAPPEVVTSLPAWAHVLYLVTMTVVATWLAARWMTKRLKP